MRVGYGAADATGRDGVAENLDVAWLTGDPPWRALFDAWLADAITAGVTEPNAMIVGTVDADGRPATRTVLCKGVSDDGIVFFTGYGSDKGRALATNPYASATFPWIAMERQVHVRGRVVKVSAAETAAYWSSRPRGSQVSASASDQSRPIVSRAALEAKAAGVAADLGADRPVPIPADWGGYRIEPEVVEFWQGRADRLHNRVRAVRDGDSWRVDRLQP
ncbi:pyridoxamine 5'-phosphate oxidase [Gordonia liuliyuniae]|uniref:Pyridoxine/pyridoxamine 5'-phosphate oxidase n=1 Tax=Gordonia liuliyuniae TaxID=2911517 RepID=A0ABS9IMU7_9ACTN|nr:pyridoxamine 5'-phosphate oxidase [Gordonia liuliyuniae]MCF8586877.1 pyridoxamine 5'-phosphate oxidase [Gordonia liuliyuniae]